MLVPQIVDVPQTLTGSWVDLGREFRTDRKEKVSLWLDITINDSENLRIRILGKLNLATADEYCLPISTVSGSEIDIQDEYNELSDDVDQKIVVNVLLEHLIPVIQWQVQVGTVGATPAVINSAYMTWGKRR